MNKPTHSSKVEPGGRRFQISLHPDFSFHVAFRMFGGAATFLKFGLVFLITLQVYVYAFDRSTSTGFTTLQVAAATGLDLTLFSILILPIRENRPPSPVSMFA